MHRLGDSGAGQDVQLASQAHFVDVHAPTNAVNIDDASLENDAEQAPERLQSTRKPAQQRLFSPLATRTNSNGASMSHFVVIVPPPDLPIESIKSRNATALGNTQASHIRRGILLPLYPTLGGQLYAIAREFGLPSVGGLSLYLCDDGAGSLGPRIGDATWSALWSGFFEEPTDDTFDESQDVENRSAPLPYSRSRGPALNANVSASNISRSTIPRAASVSSMGNQSAYSSASFVLETGRMPIVGRFEWAVDTRRAKWWRSFVGEEEAQDEPAPAQDTRRASLPRPLRLNSRSGTRDDGHDSDALSAPVSAASMPEGGYRTAPSDGVPTSIPTSNIELPNTITETKPEEDDIFRSQPRSDAPEQEAFDLPEINEVPERKDLGSPSMPAVVAAQEPTSHESGEQVNKDEIAAEGAREAEPEKEEGRASGESDHKGFHPVSGSLASLSAAASRFFGGHSEHKRAASASAATRPSALTVPSGDVNDYGDKPHTPNEAHIPVEALRERLSATEHHDRTARRHMQRASVEVPGSVRNASARISAVIGADNAPQFPSSSFAGDGSPSKRSVSAGNHAGVPAEETRGTFELPEGGAGVTEPSQEPLWRKLAGIPPSNSGERIRHRATASDATGLRSGIGGRGMDTDIPEVPQVASAVRKGHMSRPSLRSPIVLGNSLVDEDSANQDIAATELARIRSITRKKSSHLDRASDLINTKIDSDSLKRQSSLEFDNTLGDLQRALELLSPSQTPRVSSAPRAEPVPKPRWFFRTRIDGEKREDRALDSAPNSAVPMDPDAVFAEGHGPGAVDSRSLEVSDVTAANADSERPVPVPVSVPEPTVELHGSDDATGLRKPDGSEQESVARSSFAIVQPAIAEEPKNPVGVEKPFEREQDLRNDIIGAHDHAMGIEQPPVQNRESKEKDALASRPISNATGLEFDTTPAYVNMGLADMSSTGTVIDNGADDTNPYPQSGGTLPPVGSSSNVLSNRFSQDQWSQDSRRVSLNSSALDSTPRADKKIQQMTQPPPLPPKDTAWPTSHHPWSNNRLSNAASSTWSEASNGVVPPVPDAPPIDEHDAYEHGIAQSTGPRDPVGAFKANEPPSQFSPDIGAEPLPQQPLAVPPNQSDPYSPRSEYDERFSDMQRSTDLPNALQTQLGSHNPFEQRANLAREQAQMYEQNQQYDPMLDALNAQAARDVAPQESDWAPWTSERTSSAAIPAPPITMPAFPEGGVRDTHVPSPHIPDAGIHASTPHLPEAPHVQVPHMSDLHVQAPHLPQAPDMPFPNTSGMQMSAPHMPEAPHVSMPHIPETAPHVASPLVPGTGNAQDNAIPHYDFESAQRSVNADAVATGLPSAGLPDETNSLHTGLSNQQGTSMGAALPGAAGSAVTLPHTGTSVPGDGIGAETSPRFDLPSTPRPDHEVTDFADDMPKSSMSPISPPLHHMGSMPDLKSNRTSGNEKQPSSPTSGPRNFLSKMSPRFKWAVGRRKKSQSIDDSKKIEELKKLAESESAKTKQSAGKGMGALLGGRDESNREHESSNVLGVPMPYADGNNSSISLPLHRSDAPEQLSRGDDARRGISTFFGRSHNSASSDQFSPAYGPAQSPHIVSPDLDSPLLPSQVVANEAAPGTPPREGAPTGEMPAGFVQAHPRDSFMRGIGLSANDNNAHTQLNQSRVPSEAWNTSMPQSLGDVHLPEGQPHFASLPSHHPQFQSDAFANGGAQNYMTAGTFGSR